MAEPRAFIYIAPRIVGTAGDHGYTYESDRVASISIAGAYKHGCRTLGHDDFWVGEMANGKVIALYSGPEKKDKRTSQSELDGINREWGDL